MKCRSILLGILAATGLWMFVMPGSSERKIRADTVVAPFPRDASLQEDLWRLPDDFLPVAPTEELKLTAAMADTTAAPVDYPYWDGNSPAVWATPAEFSAGD